MKSFFAICFATIYGLTIRMVFGVLNNIMGIMSISFLVLLPIIIGYVTVALLIRKGKLNGILAFFAPWVTTFILLVITILINIEGAICWLMIYPMVSVLSGIGGIIAFYYLKRSTNGRKGNWNNDDALDSGNSGTFKMSFVLLLPLFIGLLEGERTLVLKDINVKREVIIPASSSQVWNAIKNINELSNEEKSYAGLSNLLGFPRHLRTTLDTFAMGGHRVAYYENGLYFKETIDKFEPEKLLVLQIHTDPDKIPPTVLDEHILIGGKYLDILDDTYALEKLSNGSTRLTLNSHFIIRTPFNWYTGLWAEYLMADILDSQLTIIEKRVTKKAK